MSKEPTPPEAFDKLLSWLGPERDKAGEKYERIRLGLIRIFAANGCSEPERLTDDAFDRAMGKIDWLIENYVGEPALYFGGIARNIVKEQRRLRKEPPFPPPVENGDDDEEVVYGCFDRCMQELPERNRLLLLAYYEKEGRAKIAQRRKLAEDLGITLRALRLRVYHLRLQVRACMELSLSKIKGNEIL